MSEEQKDAMVEWRESAQAITGSVYDPKEISRRLQYADEHFFLVSPASSCGHVPPGCAIAMTAVQIDPDLETYPVGDGKVAMTKPALDRIAAGIGITWAPEMSRRLDDGSDPRYCHYRSVGRYRAFDGQWMIVKGEKELDLRDGSAQVVGVKDGKVAAQRKHILSLAETMSRLRAIRTLGIRSSYQPRELAKPFVMARIMFTGQSADPDQQKRLEAATVASFLGGSSSIYGEPPAAIAAGAPYEEPHAPPSVADAVEDDEPEDADFTEIDDEPRDGPPLPPPPPGERY